MAHMPRLVHDDARQLDEWAAIGIPSTRCYCLFKDECAGEEINPVRTRTGKPFWQLGGI
jgi:hypothetical protein